ncbi:MAG: PEP-CTERM sorting domain-containing protein [Kiritimatiellae bacterium]|nr:PEP-CTERM sorting domain-containing protein [Kiritimatiellia bacterium]
MKTKTKCILLLIGAFSFMANAAPVVIFEEDFSSDPGLVSNTTVVNPDTWYASNVGRYLWNEDAEAIRRSSGSPGAYTGLTYGFTPDDPITSGGLSLSFGYDMDFTDVTLAVAIYGAETTFGGGGGTRLRTDGINPGSNWVILAQATPTLTGSGTYTLNWDFASTNYTHVGFQIATTDLTTGGGDYFDITGVSVSVIPEPGTLALFGLAGLALAISQRRRRN